MKGKILSLTAILSIVLIFTSCSKYEDGGPLGNPEKVIAADWAFDDFKALPGTEPDLPVASANTENYSEDLIIEENGDFSHTISFESNGTEFTEEFNGQWYLFDDETRIHFMAIDDEGDIIPVDYRIIRLKKGELVLQSESGHQFFYIDE